jgi:hypothetical protein
MITHRVHPTAAWHEGRVWLLVVLACLAPASALFAESMDDRARDVAIMALPLDGAANASMADIITMAAGLRLERQGLTSLVVGLSARAAPGVDAALGILGSSKADSLLLAEFSERGSTLSLRFAWFAAGTRTWLAEVKTSGPEDMQLDGMIFKAVGDLLSLVGPRLPPRLEPGPSEAATPVEESQDLNAAPALAGPPAQPGASPALPATGVRSPDEAGAVEDRGGRGGLELSFGAGPFLPSGKLSAFFEAAGGLSGRIAWVFPGKAATLGLGLSATALVFKAQGPLEAATGILAPLALDLRFSADAWDGQFRPYLSAACGAGLMSLQTALYQRQDSILPFAELALGLSRTLSRGLEVSIDLPFLLFIDGRDLIMGFSPALECAFSVWRRP